MKKFGNYLKIFLENKMNYEILYRFKTKNLIKFFMKEGD